MIPWLRPGAQFPPVSRALAQPNGLLCAGTELTAARLLQAYTRGIFPWYTDGEPVLWWSPDPRMVLPTAELHVTRSLRKTLRATARSATLRLRLDTAFETVMRACAAPRPGQDGTWITESVVAAYVELHRRDLAHSIELWDGADLVGGLYGVSIGRMFFGESMFSRAADASKTALAALATLLLREQVPLIDCQQNTSHLASLGAREIARSVFCAHLAQAVQDPPVNWARWRAAPLNELLSAY